MQSMDQISLGTVALALLILVVGASRLHDTVWVALFVSLGVILLGSELFDIREGVLAGSGSGLLVVVGTYWSSTGDVFLGLALVAGTLLVLATRYRGRLTSNLAND